jgi:hypothetical protein
MSPKSVKVDNLGRSMFDKQGSSDGSWQFKRQAGDGWAAIAVLSGETVSQQLMTPGLR